MINHQIDAILRILKTTFPDVKTQLRHRNPFELLIATILAAQCTDRQVNAVTGDLFAAYPTPEALAEAPLPSVEALIRSTGYYRNKARHITSCARVLVADHGGVVPRTREALVALPGVGRKTANVVLSVAFGVPAVVVDTHVARISRRLGLTAHKDPARIEADLAARIPETAWNDFGLQLIYLGRSVCMARRPRCPDCPLRDLCPFP